MKLGKRFLANRIENKISARVETKDAIVWSVDLTGRRAMVKIQGTNQEIVAYFPQNWQETPTWLKPGNAVKINFVGGIRGRIELIGHGSAVPTPVSGETFPPVGNPGDGVLTGCELFALNPESMMVGVTSGSYQIEGVVYYIGGIGGPSDPPAMFGVSPPMEMGDGFPMGIPLGVGIPIDPAPSPTDFRIDLLVAGTDGAVDVVKGTESPNPVEPALPVNHVKLGTVLLHYNMTVISNFDINRAFEPRELTYVDLTFDPDHLHPLELESDGTATMRDQYNNPFTGSWSVLFYIDFGAGELNGETSFPVQVDVYGSTAHVTYTKAGATMEDSPFIRADVVDGMNILSGSFFLELKDA